MSLIENSGMLLFFECFPSKALLLKSAYAVACLCGLVNSFECQKLSEFQFSLENRTDVSKGKWPLAATCSLRLFIGDQLSVSN